MNKDNIEEILKSIGAEAVPPDVREIAQETSNNFSRSLMQPKQPRQYILLEFIMKGRMPKLAAAAVIAIIVLSGIHFWPDGDQWWLGPPAAWGQEIINKINTIKGVTCREQTIWIEPDGSRNTSSTWNIYYVSHDSYRRDIYDGDLLREIQWYVPDGDNMIQHYIRFDLGCYGAVTHSGTFGDHDPVERMRSYIRCLDEADKLLGEKVIEDRNCIGFEISASKYGDNPIEWLYRIWFDIDTKLPVLLEHEMPCPRDKTQTDFNPFINVLDQFDYSTELSAETFTPWDPEGFINAHPDDIKALREQEKEE